MPSGRGWNILACALASQCQLWCSQAEIYCRALPPSHRWQLESLGAPCSQAMVRMPGMGTGRDCGAVSPAHVLPPSIPFPLSTPLTLSCSCLEGPFGHPCHSTPCSSACFYPHHLLCERHLHSKCFSLIFLGPPGTFRAATRHARAMQLSESLVHQHPQLLHSASSPTF